MAEWYIGMSEDAIRAKVVATAVELLGIREGTEDHQKRIVEVYNSMGKLPRGYRLQEDDAWCAAFITVIGIILGISDVILPECGCGHMIELYRKQGRWMEADDYIPKPGDICMLDRDAQKGECVGNPDHVGLVEWVKGKDIGLIDGNNREGKVGRRTICVEYVKTRGFCLPDYASLVRPFADVPADAWYAADVAKAAELGIVEGVGSGLFAPDRPVTRAEVTATMVRLYDALKK